MVSKWPDGFPARGGFGATRPGPKAILWRVTSWSDLFAGNEFCESAARPANPDLIRMLFVLLKSLAQQLHCLISGHKGWCYKGNRPADGALKS